MLKVRQYADPVTILSGLLWLSFFWSVSISHWVGNAEPALAALLLLGTLILVSFVHRPTRVLLRRYHVRKRRTEMWMHILALPLTLAFFFGVIIESLITPLGGAQKLLLFNILATAGWGVFVLTLVVKWGMRRWQNRRPRERHQ